MAWSAQITTTVPMYTWLPLCSGDIFTFLPVLFQRFEKSTFKYKSHVFEREPFTSSVLWDAWKSILLGAPNEIGGCSAVHYDPHSDTRARVTSQECEPSSSLCAREKKDLQECLLTSREQQTLWWNNSREGSSWMIWQFAWMKIQIRNRNTH